VRLLPTSAGVTNPSIHEALTGLLARPKWAARMAGPAYAIDDQTAITVSGDTVEVVSEGHWQLFPAPGS
jgi:dipeptidase E